jgi:hypothetical protein
MCLFPASERYLSDLVMERSHPGENPMLGGPRHAGWAVPAAPEPDHAALCHLAAQRIRDALRRSPYGAKAVVRQRIDQFVDGRRTVVEQVRREQVAKVDAFHL